jgi:predicted DNA-binding transcriptional regulator
MFKSISIKKLDIITYGILAIINLMLAYGIIIEFVVYIGITLLITVEIWKFFRIVLKNDSLDGVNWVGYVFTSAMAFKNIGAYILIAVGMTMFVTMAALTLVATFVSWLVNRKEVAK